MHIHSATLPLLSVRRDPRVTGDPYVRDRKGLKKITVNRHLSEYLQIQTYSMSLCSVGSIPRLRLHELVLFYTEP